MPAQPPGDIDIELPLAAAEIAEQMLTKLRDLVDDPDAMPTYPLSKKQAAWELDQVIRILTHSVGLPVLLNSSLEFDIAELRLHNPFDGEIENTILRHTWNELWSWDQLEQAMDMEDWEYKPIIKENQFQGVLESPAQIYDQPRLPSSEITHAALIEAKEGTQQSQLSAQVSLVGPKPPRHGRKVMKISSSVNEVDLPLSQQAKLQDPILGVKEVEDLFSHELVNDSVYWVGGEAHNYSGPIGFGPTSKIYQSLNSVQLQHTTLCSSPVNSPSRCKTLVENIPMGLSKKTKKVVLKIGGEYLPSCLLSDTSANIYVYLQTSESQPTQPHQ